MKIEIGESLGYSYLRHVKRCWLVQTNWKPSEHWDRQLTDDGLEREFRQIRDRFDPEGNVFKGTKNSRQFLKQAEIDVVGFDQDGAIHAMDVAFHEAGLNYLGGANKRVLKKLLRTKLVLDAYHPAEAVRHIYFVSPKVHRGVQQPLEEIFDLLLSEYPSMNWHLLTNETFTNEMLEPTLEKAESVSDTAELFVRSAKLLSLADSGSAIRHRRTAVPDDSSANADRTVSKTNSTASPTLQDMVQGLMRTLLEDHHSLLSEFDRLNLMNTDYCQEHLDLHLGGFPLLRHKHEGRSISGHERYYEKVYAAQFLVSNNWWKRHHYHNAASLLRLVDGLIDKNTGNEGMSALNAHRAELLGYLDQAIS